MAKTPVCQRCGGPLADYSGNGRPARYCRAACRKAAYRARASGTRQSYPPDLWTPEQLRRRLDQEGSLGLDAAACSRSTLVPDNWLGPDHPDPGRRDALAWDNWSDLAPEGTVVWLHPPLDPVTTLRAFLARGIATAQSGRAVHALLPASTEAAWFKDLVIDAGATAEFLRGRIAFDSPHGPRKPLRGTSALVTYPTS